MDRLTDTTGQLYACGNSLCAFEPKQKCSDCKYQYEANKRLAEYENAEEQGKIIVLPCKFGDKIYYIRPAFMTEYYESDYEGFCKHYGNGYNKILDWKICYREFSVNDFDFMKIKHDIFFTKEDAEKALQEINNVKEIEK